MLRLMVFEKTQAVGSAVGIHQLVLSFKVTRGCPCNFTEVIATKLNCLDFGGLELGWEEG